jgi:hypothetical protein
MIGLLNPTYTLNHILTDLFLTWFFNEEA